MPKPPKLPRRSRAVTRRSINIAEDSVSPLQAVSASTHSQITDWLTRLEKVVDECEPVCNPCYEWFEPTREELRAVRSLHMIAPVIVADIKEALQDCRDKLERLKQADDGFVLKWVRGYGYHNAPLNECRWMYRVAFGKHVYIAIDRLRDVVDVLVSTTAPQTRNNDDERKGKHYWFWKWLEEQPEPPENPKELFELYDRFVRGGGEKIKGRTQENLWDAYSNLKKRKKRKSI